jgi:glycosyltransferase involved in cell wall biosynthesis
MIIAGDAQGREAYEGELRHMISSGRLDGRVALVAIATTCQPALALAIVIAPSREPEAFGRREAGAMGVPVIAQNPAGG